MPFHAHAETGTCSPESTNDHGVFQRKQEWYGANWLAWKMAYYAVETDTDPRFCAKAGSKGRTKADLAKEAEKRKAIRDQYVDARLDLANEHFRRFISGICERGVLPPATEKTLEGGSDTRRALNELIASRAAKIAQIKERLKQGDEKYPLFDAEQDLSDVELSSVLAAATGTTGKTATGASNPPAQPPTVSTPPPTPAPGKVTAPS